MLHPAATGTNHEAERTLRQPALDRRTGRTSKTARGARRRTIVVSVLESLRLYRSEFTLPHVREEIGLSAPCLRRQEAGGRRQEAGGWLERGTSRFQQLLTTADLPPPSESPLHHLLPLLPIATAG